MDQAITDRRKGLPDFLEGLIRANGYPGIQYVAVDSERTLFEFSGGWADVQGRVPMRPGTTMMAYSMTKTFTAAAVMQLLEGGKLLLDDPVISRFPSTPYGSSMTIRHLLSQTSGIPNPIPLKWVHLADQHESFDESRALQRVLNENSRLRHPPGSRYGYSNISYWFLGKIIEKVSGQSYPDYMDQHIFSPLGMAGSGFTIADLSHHAKGYLRKLSFMNLFKGFLIAPEFIGDYEGPWLHINNHYLNGPGFGGLVSTARDVALFLRDQLRETPVLFSKETRELFFSRQHTDSGQPVEMTLGWHIGSLDSKPFYFKEGGGGGSHAEMRIYPGRALASVIMVNETSSACTGLQARLDRAFVF